MKQNVLGVSELAVESFVNIPTADTLDINEENKEDPHEEQKIETSANNIDSSES